MSGTHTPPPAHGEPSFQRVLQQFKDEHLKGSESEQFQFANLADLRSSMKEIQDEHASKVRMRNMNRLRKFLEGMEQYESLIEVFLNASEFVAFVWGPMKFLLQVTRNHVKAFDALLDHYEDMGEQLEVLAHHQPLFEMRENGHLNNVLEMIFSDILDFHAKAMSYFRQKFWRTIFDATWNHFRTRFSEPMNNLRRHRKLLENYASLTTLERISALSNDQNEALKLQRRESKRQQQDRVRAWLSPEDMMADQEHYTELRRGYPGTGGWILRRNLVTTWLDPSANVNPILWVTGIPGAGKTILASTVIEAAARQSAAKLAFVYCKDGNRNRNDFISIARNLLYQLSRNDDPLTEYIDAIMSREGQTTLQRSELAKDLLRVVVRSHDKVFIIVDGLDECLKQEKRVIFAWIQSIVSSDSDTADQVDDVEPNLVRCLLVSQEDSESSRLLKGYPALKILPSDNYADIKTYSEAWESKIRSKHPSVKFDEGTKSITANVLKRADGMFQFARLVMANLHDQSKAFRLREELKWLSEDNEKQGVLGKLDEAYGRIFRSMRHDMEDERYRDAIRILSWVAIAQRDLSWHEIQGAVSLDLDNRVIDFEGRRFSDEDGPKDLCGSLLEVTPGGIVTLVHSTARLFLTNHHVNFAAEHLNLTTICLVYLSVGRVDVSLSDEIVEDNILNGCYAFFDYATSHWLDHLTILVTKSTNLDAVSVEGLGREIRHFLGQHFQKVAPKSIPPSFAKGFDARPLFGTEDFLDALSQAAYMWSLHFSKRWSNKRKEEFGNINNDQKLDPQSGLELFIPRLRCSLDRVAQRLKGSTGLQQLQQYHGPGLFKCRFIHCDYFHTGFPDKAARDCHQNKHDRAFFCVFDGCSHGITGFTDSRSLAAHVDNSHTSNEANHSFQVQFPVLDDPKSIDVGAAIKSGNLAAVQRWAEQFNGPIPLASLEIPRNYHKFSIGVGGFRSLRLLKTNWKSNRLDILKYMVENSEDIELAKIAVLRYSLGRSRWPDMEEWIFSSPSKLADVDAVYVIVAHYLPARNETLCLRVLEHYRQSVKPNRKRSLLQLMAKYGFLRCIRFLVLDCGLDAGHRHYKRTVLMEAAEGGRDAIVRFLVEEQHCTQETIDYKSGKGTAASIAAANGHQSVLHILAPYTTPDIFRSLISVAQLRNAAIAGDVEVVSRAINSNVPIDVPDSDEYTPFLHSVENNRKETAKLLLDHARERISINRRCLCHHRGLESSRKNLQRGATALIIAVVNGYEELVELLLECDDIDTNRKIFLKVPYFRALGILSGRVYHPVSPLELADFSGFKNIKKLLEEYEKSRQALPHDTTSNAEEETTDIPTAKEGDSDIVSVELFGEGESDASE
ncbi:hypothetical protein QBC37DRAFT_430021 [Rhypophila decipiens]|uniref:NACHT domain-containing protein n=1 Tax=Rhypophila decipiens TaxID=261697 RepID=A0AAN6Y1R5_9PEZI|nr:hypothetical protein QBC37DRAFT_430021 [Rhypophila decipiens]